MKEDFKTYKPTKREHAMNRKHYVEIAESFKSNILISKANIAVKRGQLYDADNDTQETLSEIQSELEKIALLSDVAADLALVLKKENTRFNFKKFFDYIDIQNPF